MKLSEKIIELSKAGFDVHICGHTETVYLTRYIVVTVWFGDHYQMTKILEEKIEHADDADEIFANILERSKNDLNEYMKALAERKE